ncbi:MAG TPA: SemiSWEET family transporter [Chryseolinea sp.]|nr:SemiSWEET family transporter [Chryseolinea sp.]
MQYNTIIGVAASILTATSLIPQLVKLVKEKKPQAVSHLMLVVLSVGHALWIYYGVLRTDPIIIAANVFAVLVDLLVVILAIKYKYFNRT